MLSNRVPRPATCYHAVSWRTNRVRCRNLTMLINYDRHMRTTPRHTRLHLPSLAETRVIPFYDPTIAGFFRP